MSTSRRLPLLAILRRRLGAGALGALGVAGALTGALAAAPAAAGAQSARPQPAAPAAPPARGARPRSPAPAAAALESELRRVTRQQEAVAERLERLASSLSRRRATPALSDSLTALVRSHAALTNQVAMLEARLRFVESESRTRRAAPVAIRARQPEGWFGVHVETVSDGEARVGGATVVRSVDYPKVLSVEPGSPAARAGLQAGDRLMAIAGVDLRASAFDPRTLRPGQTLPVRLSRDGRLREVRVAITPRPRTFATGVTVRVATGDDARRLAALRTGGSATIVGGIGPDAPTPRVVSVEEIPAGTVVLPSGVRMPAPARTPEPSAVLFYASPSVAAVAGAEVMRLNPELRATLDVRDGVFVVQVARSSPAERAGVQQGDVLVRANGVTLANPLVLQRVVAEARGEGEDGVRLDLVRGKRTRTVTLRW